MDDQDKMMIAILVLAVFQIAAWGFIFKVIVGSGMLGAVGQSAIEKQENN